MRKTAPKAKKNAALDLCRDLFVDALFRDGFKVFFPSSGWHIFRPVDGRVEYCRTRRFSDPDLEAWCFLAGTKRSPESLRLEIDDAQWFRSIRQIEELGVKLGSREAPTVSIRDSDLPKLKDVVRSCLYARPVTARDTETGRDKSWRLSSSRGVARKTRAFLATMGAIYQLSNSSKGAPPAESVDVRDFNKLASEFFNALPDDDPKNLRYLADKLLVSYGTVLAIRKGKGCSEAIRRQIEKRFTKLLGRPIALKR